MEMDTNHVTYRLVETPVGKMVAGATAKGCCVFEFADRGGLERIKTRVLKRYGMPMVEGSSSIIDTIISQVNEYFAGTRTQFNFPFDLKGTPFELSVWEELQKIPYGETRSYGQIAAVLGKPSASRAVGRANGANYCAIIIPCHRVIKADGNLRGYGGGVWRKQYLLDLERKCAGQLVSDLFSDLPADDLRRSKTGVVPGDIG
jgi:AraC family transcriptional regulator of adaptative response/methylated-DNA-[protein]-cysteine methyltransferase